MKQLKDLLNSMTILKDMSINTIPLLVLYGVLAVIALAVIAFAICRYIRTKGLSRYLGAIFLASYALTLCILSIIDYTKQPQTIKLVVAEEHLADVNMHHYFEVPDLRADGTIVITPRDEYYDDIFEWYKSRTTLHSE